MNKDFSALSEKIKQLTEFIASGKPLRIVRVEGLNHFQRSFTNQGFTDKTLKRWTKRKPPKWLKGDALKKWKDKDAGRAILVGHASTATGTHLKDSIKAEIINNGVVFSSDKLYAQTHNDGLKAGRPPGFTMPQREFIGRSETLENNIKNKLEREMNKILNSN